MKMIHLNCDYLEGCHPAILKRLTETNLEQTVGYGNDPYCAEAAGKIREAFSCPDSAVHFLVGGTQANTTIIASALRPYEGVICAHTGHINVHETGAIEATGHKVIALPSDDGKISAQQVDELVQLHWAGADHEHMAQPKLVYISNPTELGTIYNLAELEALHSVCQKRGLYLYVDGARLGYGLTAKDNDVTLADMARLCDDFYIGGTKCGAMFGEAVVISNDTLKEDFRYLMKRHGGMLAKGWQLGVQFDALFENDLYFTICQRANRMADRIRDTLRELGVPSLAQCITNQIFPIFSNAFFEELIK